MKILLMILFISTPVLSETFRMAGEEVKFVEKEGLLLKGCEKDCEALRVIKKNSSIPGKKIYKAKTFADSPGSAVCNKIYKGRSILGLAQNKDGRAFCFFKDKSMVEINSLTKYLKNNKIIKE